MRMLGSLLITATMVYLALAALLYVSQPRMIYFPVREVSVTPKAQGLEFESVSLTTEDGVTLDGWFLPAPAARGTLLFLHGNAGNISHRLDSLEIFHRLGLSTLIIDYRGYGRSDGKPSEAGTYMDAAAAWRYLVKQRGIAPNHIVVFGRSLGGAVAVWLATRETPGALILESSFTSVPDFASEIYPWLPVRWLSRFRYDAQAGLPSVTCPVLIVHSREDDIIPIEHGRRLYRAANAPKQFLEIHGDHNTGFLVSREDYVAGLTRFLDGYFDRRAPND